MLCPIRTGLWDEDLDLAVVKVETQNSILDGNAVCGVEDIADDFTFTEASVGNISMNLPVDIVCETDEELSTSESVNLIINPFLSEGVVYNSL